MELCMTIPGCFLKSYNQNLVGIMVLSTFLGQGAIIGVELDTIGPLLYKHFIT